AVILWDVRSLLKTIILAKMALNTLSLIVLVHRLKVSDQTKEHAILLYPAAVSSWRQHCTMNIVRFSEK
ncbi:MAG: hypothetical protein MUE72_10080, partial [Chitinophagaceae bacterium]|nr:hypothetical protein [Chitinophagaceae bacterium]